MSSLCCSFIILIVTTFLTYLRYLCLCFHFVMPFYLYFSTFHCVHNYFIKCDYNYRSRAWQSRLGIWKIMDEMVKEACKEGF